TKELSELLPLMNFWLLPSVYPATAEEIRHKYRFIMEALSKMGLPVWDDEIVAATEKVIADITAKEGEQP
ncbi:MAG: TetR/AcrR family transcriptional regulator, partial [Lachnospiraceae bacterium]|nr:TetR/AcrR family transcriptional regulator [Lachnospiraceae bacterium]